MKRLCIQFLTVVILLSIGITSIYAKDALELALTFDKKEYKKNDNISLDLLLKNNGDKNVYVNTRFFVNSKDSKAEYREVYFEVAAPNGEKLIFTRDDLKCGFPRQDFFYLLEPGKEIKMERSKSLKSYFKMDELGEYKVKAVYENSYGKEIGLDVYKDKVISNEVKIKMIE